MRRLVFLIGISLWAFAQQVSGAEALGLAQDRTPPDWQRASSVMLGPQALAALSKKFEIPLSEGVNQSFQTPEGVVRVNGLAPAVGASLPALARALFAAVGDQNAVLRGEEAVYEVISDSAAVKRRLARLLPALKPLERVKILGGVRPKGWKLTNEVEADNAALTRIGASLGAPVQAALNQFFQVGTTLVQVNYMALPDSFSAAALALKLSGRGGVSDFLALDATVVEILTPDADFRALVRELLADRIPATRAGPWMASMDLALLSGCPGSRAQSWSTALVRAAADDPSGQRDLGALLGAAESPVTTSDTLSLWQPERRHLAVTYRLTPAPKTQNRSGEWLVAVFEDAPRLGGVPVVHVEATLNVQPRRPDSGFEPEPLDPATRARLCEGTKHWPKQDARIRALVETSTSGLRSELSRAESLLSALRAKVRYGGEEIGARVGVSRTLDQGYGRCWDLSDVYVTLCRAAGIPARQLAGWLSDQGGHVWCEIHLAGIGWLPVDPTTDKLGATEPYLPWFASDDGDFAPVYARFPVITAP